MYQALLTRRYLTSKIMPLLASLAVLLCSAMVLISWSVMGGFLQTLVGSGRTMVGDVVIGWPNAGFAHYDDLIKRLEADPMIEAAAPVIEAYGVVGLPDGRPEPVMIKGIDPASFSRVTSYKDILWWKPIAEPLPKDKDKTDPRLLQRLDPPDLMERLAESGMTLERRDAKTGATRPGVVLGIEVSGFNTRQPTGVYIPKMFELRRPDGSIERAGEFLPRDGSVSLNVLAVDASGRVVESASQQFAVVNEFHSGVFDADSRTVFAPIAVLQKMLKLDAAKKVERSTAPFRTEIDPATGVERVVEAAAETGVMPARVTAVYVRGKGDYSQLGTSRELRRRCESIYAAFAAAHENAVPQEFDIHIRTWEDLNRTMISAVQKERLLVLFLFSIISVVSLFLILAIFWAMVSEKTKDVGTLRAIGASRSGIAGIWLLYALAIGVVGAALGVGLAYLIVVNINPIHEWLGRALNVQIWDPRIYYFVKIPNEVDSSAAVFVFLVGVLSSAAAALWPAVRAANMNPVRALRFE